MDISRFKGIVFDIDNTAVKDSETTVGSERLKKSSKLVSLMMPCIVATGRTARFTLPITRELELNHQSVIANGAALMDPRSGTLSNKRFLGVDQVAQILEINMSTDNQICFACDTNEMIKPARDKLPKECMGVYISSLSKDDALSLQSTLVSNVDQAFVYVSEGWSISTGAKEYDVNISHIMATKENAAIKALGLYGLELKDVVFVGDGINDVALISEAGYGIAVENAQPEALAAAKEIVPDYRSDGLAGVMERMVVNYR